MLHGLVEFLSLDLSSILMGIVGASVAGYLGRDTIMGFFIGVFGDQPEVLSPSPIQAREGVAEPANKHHQGIEELFVAKQMLDRGEISQAEYEDAHAELMAKLN